MTPSLPSNHLILKSDEDAAKSELELDPRIAEAQSSQADLEAGVVPKSAKSLQEKQPVNVESDEDPLYVGSSLFLLLLLNGFRWNSLMATSEIQ